MDCFEPPDHQKKLVVFFVARNRGKVDLFRGRIVSKITFILFVLFLPLYAHGATCDAGYYLENGTCTICTNGYYCPGDGTRVACPLNTLTPQEISEHTGADLQSSTVGTYVSSLAHNSRPSSQDDCHINFRSGHIEGEKCLFYQVAFHYDTSSQTYVPSPGDPRFYNRADVGGYLSDYSHSGYYRTCNQCTNAPANAHYTGPGTPDSTDGSVVDANDCPWECDDGYYNDNGTCTICPAGYACSGGVMTSCTNVTGPNGRATYSGIGQSSCTECPAVSSDIENRVVSYAFWGGSYDALHTNISGCLVYFTVSDPDATGTQWCMYSRYGYQFSTCSFRATGCGTGKYETLKNSPEWVGRTNSAQCRGIDCMNGKICTDVGTGYYSPDGDTLRYACDTPPANAHIISACTSATNIVWECDSGTVHMSNDTCEPLCTAGMTKLRTSTGLSFNIYANKLTTPSLNLSQNNIVCYVNLLPGVASGAINVRYGNTVYHTAN